MEIYPYRTLVLYLAFFAAGWIWSFFLLLWRLCLENEGQKLLRVPAGCPPVISSRFWQRARERRAKRTTRGFVLTFFSDLLFCLLLAVTAILLFFYLDDGRIRPGPIVLMLSGGLLYRLTLYKVIMPWLSYLLLWGKAVVGYALAFVCFPFWRLVLMTKNIIGKLIRKGKAYQKEKRNYRFDVKERKFLTEKSDRGFLEEKVFR